VESLGNVEIQRLGVKNGSGAILMAWIQKAALLSEWPQVRKIILDRYIGLESDKVWRNFLIEMQDLYPNFAKLIRFLVIVPFSTVECERGFSQFNSIKTKLRNKISWITMVLFGD
jgi:hypothetical protein